MESDDEEEAAPSLTCSASRPHPASLTAPPARSRRARRRRRQIREDIRFSPGQGGSGWKQGTSAAPPWRKAAPLGVAAAGPAGPAKVSPGPLAGHQLAPTPGPESKSQATADGEREVAGKGFRTSRSDEESSRRGRIPPATRRPRGRARWPAPPANAAHRPTTSPLRQGPPPKEPQASKRGRSAEIPAATFTGVRAGFPAAVSGSGEGMKGEEGGGGGRGTLVAPESPRGATRGPGGGETSPH